MAPEYFFALVLIINNRVAMESRLCFTVKVIVFREGIMVNA